MDSKLITVTNLTLERQGIIILDNLSFSLNQGDQLLLTGGIGVGKSSLGLALCGKLHHGGKVELNFENIDANSKIIFVSQVYTFNNKTRINDFYYQQRYNSYDAGDSATVREVLLNLGTMDASVIPDEVSALLKQLNMFKHLDTPLLQLSSGERKKLQLIDALSQRAQIIVLDNPYIGLDQVAVVNLNLYLAQMIVSGLTIILISDDVDIPAFITHVATLHNAHTLELLPIASYIKLEHNTAKSKIVQTNLEVMLEHKEFNYQRIIEFNNISVDYAGKRVLHNINWQVNKGDKWLLQGHNGAGKSTLLSLINGDHPQSYANEIMLFGNKRGSGETIWEIKQNIGFISLELHWYFTSGLTCLDAVTSGFFDTHGIYTKVKPNQTQSALDWLERFQLSGYKDRPFSTVSNGIQRVILLARALVKNPPLFILDEPCQGLDDANTQQFMQMLDILFSYTNRTMIYVSHRTDQIPNCITHTLRLENGHVI